MYEYSEPMPLDESFIEFIKALWGDEGIAIISFLSENFDVTDEVLSQKTGIKLNDVRKILYSFYENQLVSYKRIRDKTTGWFIYLWRLNKDNIEFIINSRKHAVLEKLKERYEYEKQHIFLYCPKDNARYTFEEALENGFKCNICGGNLESFNNDLIIQFLEKKIKEIEEDISKHQS